MRFGLNLCNHGDFADPSLLADLAVRAETRGWDGVFLWDHVARDGDPPMVDPWITLAAIAARTSRVRLGTMVTPLARRRPWKLAREVVTLDHLSGGRVVLGVGLGVHPEEFGHVGDESDPVARASLLDESLELLTALWTGDPVEHHGPDHDVVAWHRPTPVQDRVPVWVAGRWPTRAPFRRAARWDGAIPSTTSAYEPDDHRAMLEFVADHRTRDTPFDQVHLTHLGDLERWEEYAAAGVTWWLENVRSGLRTVAEVEQLVDDGPPS